MAPDTAAASRPRRRWVAAVALVLAFAAWHAVFDVTIDRAMKAYVEGQERHLRGDGPPRDIRRDMAEARARGARQGLYAAGGALILSWAAARAWARARVRARVSG